MKPAERTFLLGALACACGAVLLWFGPPVALTLGAVGLFVFACVEATG